MATAEKLPARNKVKAADTWDLASLFPDAEGWEKAFRAWEKKLDGFARFRGELGKGPTYLADCLKFDLEIDRLGEKLGAYAFLKVAEDAGDSSSQGRKAQYLNAASKAAQAASFIRPEILSLSDKTLAEYLDHKSLKPYRWLLEQLIRYKPHTLTANEEKLLAMQIEMAQSTSNIFDALNDVDLKFGVLSDKSGNRFELSHGRYSQCLHSTDRALRKKAFHAYYKGYEDHAHTLAATLSGSIQRDIYYARVRGHQGSLDSALFDDHVPKSVYDNLIHAVHDALPSLHRYYEIRRRAMKLKDIHQYDTYVPILANLKVEYPWNKACSLLLDSLAPLGEDYTQTLKEGLLGRWCDKYENKGKDSGAFSFGSYDSHPFILMNYKSDLLNHVFTLTHEAGHAMHSFYSAKHQPYQYYSYKIFVAEVASTFNEQLLLEHLLAKAKKKEEKAYYINRAIDDIRGTIFRQTMFAEFEKLTHELAENNEPLTLDRFRGEYKRLLELYFGPKFALDDVLSLECFRIPHFYRAFYVYKYATGLSAAIALSRLVLGGGERERANYLKFLSGGGSKYPLDLLRDAGVDMETPAPVASALAHFDELVDQLDSLLNGS